MQPTKAEWPANGLPVRIEGMFLVCRENEQNMTDMKFPIHVHDIQCAEVFDFYGKFAITIKSRCSANMGRRQRHLVFDGPVFNIFRDREAEAIDIARKAGENVSDYAKHMDLSLNSEVLEAQEQFCKECDSIISGLKQKTAAVAPKFFIDHRKTAIPRIWIDDDLFIIKRGKVIGSMANARAARYDMRTMVVVMHDCKRISTRSPMFGWLSKTSKKHDCRSPQPVVNTFRWVAETAEEIVSCDRLYQRLEVVRRRNDEWRSNRAFEEEQFKLIHKKETTHDH